MRQLVLAWVLLCCGAIPAWATTAENGFSQKSAEASLTLELRTIARVDVSALWFNDSEGDRMPTAELYLTQYNRQGYPRIIDGFTGHTPQLQAVDLDGDGQVEILLRYKAGGHQTLMNVYRLEGNLLRRLPSDDLVSDRDGIELQYTSAGEPRIRIISSRDTNADKALLVTTDYRLQDGKLVEAKD
ncbi:hypothetical protein [Shewanella algae]|uniref:hypothetical protein n=1 Tax=Shewanella algae TaxID=38313 RepID=UPI001BEF8730|nr:hypothetical protein [Shewanella algae]BCV29600.1 hypothetical protein TUM3811_34600 [Shewanella algae]